jgi:hypothetical protein
MSIPVLTQVYDEMRRLAIAGSAVAPGDFRLRKLIPPLEKSGEKAPVFAKVAQAVQAVVDSNDKTASAALLELTTLVNAILYTQGETGIVGELKALDTTDLGCQSTQASARTLKPLLEALSSTGSGRMELVRDAFDRGTFKDLRLIKPALDAIDDPYPEIGEFIAEKVLPLYGKAILPELRAKLDIKGRGGHIKRLQLMHHLDAEGTREVVQQALNDGSKEMRVAAIECLGTAGDDLVFLLEQSRAKAKDVRAAAFRALAAAGTSSGDVVAALKKGIASGDLDLIIGPVRQCSLTEVREYVIEHAGQQLAALLKTKDKKEQAAAVTRLQQLVLCLEGRTDAKAEAFLLECFDHAAALAAIKSEPAGADLNEVVAHALAKGTPKMQKRLVAAHATLTGGMLPPALFAARATMSPAEFHETFSPLLTGQAEKRAKKGSADRDRAAALLSILTADDENYYHFAYRPWLGLRFGYGELADKKALPALDPRWLDAAVKAESVPLVCELARPDHAAANKFLSDQLAAAKKPHESQAVLRTMVRVRHPDAVDALINTLKKLAKDAHHYYLSYWYGPMVVDLPRSAVPKVEEALAGLPDKMVDNLMESLIALKNKPE